MFLMLGIALAYSQENDKIIKYQKETEIDFDGIEVLGDLVKPQGALIVERSGVKFNPLIELRMDFDHEMSSSVNLIK